MSPRKGKKRAPAIDSKVTCETFETTDEASLAISETPLAISETPLAAS
ncbi:hypothetical protein PF005_g16684 [Phytophthora fragariae]|uniref:Uncharacterized protein n=1 Tax=Phytophthora fragariae TaxID=53985 RepID=A0A6A3PHD8_9STRA|nr:hypothetical protein PF003_g31083 [Phytophthora fragariae]KAE8946672.1 hypothetical protein PF009_g3707 [Phytophthora fragariae]KAE9053005.1 hypothetical protein PF006_g33696 [Phytophthora fragariae]KAE9067653.1 hypothetical protein PF007_g27989 [Phytophthora fragariae]KAE9196993.1 hypothetical protein PF005_g16684 [Phytophthora fragariae]